MGSGMQFSRRTVLGIAIGTIAGARTARAHAGIPATMETWVSGNGVFTVTYDPDVWGVLPMTPPDPFTLVLATDPTFINPRYWFYLTPLESSWETVADAEAHAMDGWMVPGVEPPTVTGEFTTDNAYGWIHYNPVRYNTRRVTISQYIVDDRGTWTFMAICVDAEAFEQIDINHVFDAISMNDGSVFVVAPQRTMVDAITAAFAA